MEQGGEAGVTEGPRGAPVSPEVGVAQNCKTQYISAYRTVKHSIYHNTEQ